VAITTVTKYQAYNDNYTLTGEWMPYQYRIQAGPWTDTPEESADWAAAMIETQKAWIAQQDNPQLYRLSRFQIYTTIMVQDDSTQTVFVDPT
jgi:hypothetical protein